MATQTQETPKHVEPEKRAGAKQIAEKDIKTLQAFWTKFNNDWVMNFAAGLAFNLITAIFPIIIALLAIAGFIFGSFVPSIQQELISRIQSIFPPPISSGDVIQPALTSLSKNAGLFAIIAILLAIFAGSRLFISMEGYFSIIFHTRQRTLIRQNMMALGMLLLFVILVPLMIFASSIPAIVQSLLTTLLGNFVGRGIIISLIGIVASLFFTWILFEAIYIVVPNQHISFRNSWRGAVVAAIALDIYLYLFPFYVTHFLSNDTGKTGFAVILLFFFYYFAVILLLGAEINAFFAENVRATPDTVPAMVHNLTSHLPTSEKQVQQQAPPSHKAVEPKDIHPKGEVKHLENQEARPSQPAQPASLPEHKHDQPVPSNHTDHAQKDKHKSSSQGSSKVLIFTEALAGTALAFFVQFFNLRRKK